VSDKAGQGSVTRYWPTAQERLDVGDASSDPWLAFIQCLHDDDTATVVIFAHRSTPNGDFFAMSKKCDPGTGEGQYG